MVSEGVRSAQTLMSCKDSRQLRNGHHAKQTGAVQRPCISVAPAPLNDVFERLPWYVLHTSTIKDVLKEFARHGVRKVAMINGHFENSMFIVEGVDLAIRELRWDGIMDFSVVVLSYWDFVTEETIRTIYPDGFPGWAVEHGGILETSLMLHLHPHLVDMSKVVDHPPATFPPYDFFPVKPEWTPSSGGLSSAKPASAEKGKLPAGSLRGRDRARTADRVRLNGSTPSATASRFEATRSHRATLLLNKTGPSR